MADVNPVFQTITTAITPYIGQMMARTSIEVHCRRLGVDMSRPDAGQIDKLLNAISLGLNVFIGREKTESVVRDIRLSIGDRAL